MESYTRDKPELEVRKDTVTKSGSDEVAIYQALSHTDSVPEFYTDGDKLILSRYPQTLASSTPMFTELPELILSLLDKLESIHDAGVMHGDIKPPNILVRGKDVRFIDFEFAEILGPEGVSLRVCGTPGFMHPRIDEPHNWAVDIYALGVTIDWIRIGTISRVRRGFPLLSNELKSRLTNIDRAITELVKFLTSHPPLLFDDSIHSEAKSKFKAALNGCSSEASPTFSESVQH